MQSKSSVDRPRQDFFKHYGGTAPENYQRFFVPAIGAPLAMDLVEDAALRTGERVLDVACGTGVVTRMAKTGVGSGAVTGIDMNPAMLAVARAVPSGEHIEWHEGRAELLPLKDASFDVVFCQLGLQFVSDKHAALREMRRVLVPDGRLCLNVVGPMPRVFALMDEALARFVGPEASTFMRLVFSLSDTAALERSLIEAEFRQASTKSITRKLRLPTPAEFLWQYVRSTPLCAPMGLLDDERRTALEREIVSSWGPLVEDGALVCELPVVTATANA